VSARKARITAQAERAATKAFDLLNQKLDSDGDKLTANQLVPIAGVSVDKLLALRGDARAPLNLINLNLQPVDLLGAFLKLHEVPEGTKVTLLPSPEVITDSSASD
jgi:hypothetical protein